METVDYTIKVPKELKDIIDLLDGILVKVVNKEQASTFVELIDELLAAVDGVQNVAAEAKSEYRDEAAGYLVHKLLGTLLPVTPSE